MKVKPLPFLVVPVTVKLHVILSVMLDVENQVPRGQEENAESQAHQVVLGNVGNQALRDREENQAHQVVLESVESQVLKELLAHKVLKALQVPRGQEVNLVRVDQKVHLAIRKTASLLHF